MNDQEFTEKLAILQRREERLRNSVSVADAKVGLRARFIEEKRVIQRKWSLGFSGAVAACLALGVVLVTYQVRRPGPLEIRDQAEQVLQSVLVEDQLDLFDSDVLSLRELS